MSTHLITADIMRRISIFSIEFKNGFYEVHELNAAISKHQNLQEAQWIRSVLESEATMAA
jgi:hypothetical protein